MPCVIVAGGQYGSEGKGKVVALTASQLPNPWVVRCGGPNSGHTITVAGQEIGLRQVPAGAAHPNALLLLAAGSVIDPDLLLAEADQLRLPRERLIVDSRAVLLRPEDRESESLGISRIGSTASGTGAALVRRMMRDGSATLAGGSAALRERFRVETIAGLLHEHLNMGGHVIVEGTQGFGLSLFHGPHYPFVTARDTTAAGFGAEVGIPPRQVTEVILVVRTFPIRVGGNSGPLEHEISWEEVSRLSGAPEVIPEFTTVTRRLRRVGMFDMGLVKLASQYNGATSLAVMGLDRLDYANHGVRHYENLSSAAQAFLELIQSETKVPLRWVGTGFATADAIHVPAVTPTRQVANAG